MNKKIQLYQTGDMVPDGAEFLSTICFSNGQVAHYFLVTIPVKCQVPGCENPAIKNQKVCSTCYLLASNTATP